MKIAVTGAGGLVGSRLVPFLKKGGHEVIPIVRRKASGDGIHWDPYRQELDTENLADVDALVHLSGENIAGRWTAEKKRKIRESRVAVTRFLCDRLLQMEDPPPTVVAASAIGFYGDRGNDYLTEDDDGGSGFLASVTAEWEAATHSAIEEGIRVVNLRIGVVLSPEGGALQKMLLPFKIGLGGTIGDGRQYWSWITIDDLIGIIQHAIKTDYLIGPVNAVVPEAVTNAEFTKVLGKVLSRPTLLPMPAFAARLAFGEMADALLLSSTRVEPTRLLKTEFEFRHPDLEEGLSDLLDHHETIAS